MQVPVYDTSGKAKGNIDLAKAFSVPVREDLIKRAVVSEQALERQPYGTDPLAGMRSSAHYHGRRGIRGSMMNKEMARMHRIHGMGFLNFTARIVPQAIKGRKAHPPKADKIFDKKINKKEWRNALFSAIAATKRKELVSSRGHMVEKIEHLPIVFDDSLQDIKKTKDIVALFESIGLGAEMDRAKQKKVRAGKGTARGRKYKKKKSALIIVSEKKGIEKAARNISGVDVVLLKDLKVEMLAPGSEPGRLTIWTKSAVAGVDSMK